MEIKLIPLLHNVVLPTAANEIDPHIQLPRINVLHILHRAEVRLLIWNELIECSCPYLVFKEPHSVFFNHLSVYLSLLSPHLAYFADLFSAKTLQPHFVNKIRFYLFFLQCDC